MSDDARYYEVKNDHIKSLMHDISQEIRKAVPKGWGFTLMLFELGDRPALFYISSASREDMVSAMKEFIAREGNSGSGMVQ